MPWTTDWTATLANALSALPGSTSGVPGKNVVPCGSFGPAVQATSKLKCNAQLLTDFCHSTAVAVGGSLVFPYTEDLENAQSATSVNVQHDATPNQRQHGKKRGHQGLLQDPNERQIDLETTSGLSSSSDGPVRHSSCGSSCSRTQGSACKDSGDRSQPSRPMPAAALKAGLQTSFHLTHPLVGSSFLPRFGLRLRQQLPCRLTLSAATSFGRGRAGSSLTNSSSSSSSSRSLNSRAQTTQRKDGLDNDGQDRSLCTQSCSEPRLTSGHANQQSLLQAQNPAFCNGPVRPMSQNLQQQACRGKWHAECQKDIDGDKAIRFCADGPCDSRLGLEQIRVSLQQRRNGHQQKLDASAWLCHHFSRGKQFSCFVPSFCQMISHVHLLNDPSDRLPCPEKRGECLVNSVQQGRSYHA